MNATPSPDALARPTPPHLVRWLDQQLHEWESANLITGEQSAAVRSRYVPARRLALAHIVTGLGTTFVAVGIVWFVATNYDDLSPVLRFIIIAALWLGLATVAEVLAARRPATPLGLDGPRDVGPSLIAVCRTLAAAAFGAVIFQAAQSLQVPAFEPRLVGCWALGALLYAYATSSRGALGIGLLASAIWFVWFTAQQELSMVGTVALLLAAGLLATSVAVAHVPALTRHRPGFAQLWRLVGAGFTLAGLFLAALPVGATWGGHPAGSGAWAIWVVAALMALAALALTLFYTRLHTRVWNERAVEVVAAAAAVGAGLALSTWQPGDPFGAGGGEAWAHAIVAVLVFVAAAAWYA
ncbi:MAG: DUF2157 domain-containing protein, partial [Mobilicoccus sp.]|nr:DUF2157 domain-containing protein [Mobilicoccus sp.]